ncbi:MAG: DUF29 domain-containing protein, partial [Pseudomonadota bacterium]
ADIDFENLMDEVEDLGKSEKRALLSRLSVLQAHLLKWKFQPERRGSSWEATIKVQRLDLSDLLADNPSLTPFLREEFGHAYQRALALAEGETGLKDKFPTTSPFTIEETLDPNFWPSADTMTR